MTIPPEVNEDRRRRLANQRLFRRCYVKCSCERGCYMCAYTGLVTRGQAKHATQVRQDDERPAPGRPARGRGGT